MSSKLELGNPPLKNNLDLSTCVMLFIGLRPHGSGPVYLCSITCQRFSETNYGRVARKQHALGVYVIDIDIH